MISSHGIVLGAYNVKVKIFNITKEVIVFVLKLESKNLKFLIRLDLIQEFQLCQNENFKNGAIKREDSSKKLYWIRIAAW